MSQARPPSSTLISTLVSSKPQQNSPLWYEQSQISHPQIPNSCYNPLQNNKAMSIIAIPHDQFLSDQKQFGRKCFISSDRLHSISEESQNRKSSQEPGGRNWNSSNAAYWIASGADSVSFLRTICTGVETPTFNVLGLPYQLLIDPKALKSGAEGHVRSPWLMTDKERWGTVRTNGEGPQGTFELHRNSEWLLTWISLQRLHKMQFEGNYSFVRVQF